MKQCPHCGAQLQQQAKFCLYCMRSLEEKQNITPKFPCKRWLWWILGSVMLGLAALILLLALGREETASETAPSALTEATQTTAAENTLQICSFEAFTDGAMYADNTLWEPFMAFYAGDFGHWSKFSIPVSLPETQMELYFYQDGVKVCGVISGVLPDDLEDAVLVTNSLVDILCAGYPSGRKGFKLTADDLQQAAVVLPAASLASTCFPEDPAGDQADADTPWTVNRIGFSFDAELFGYPDASLTCELRQRHCQGDAVYDLFVYLENG